jgi:hypothetical protein
MTFIDFLRNDIDRDGWFAKLRPIHNGCSIFHSSRTGNSSGGCRRIPNGDSANLGVSCRRNPVHGNASVDDRSVIGSEVVDDCRVVEHSGDVRRR